MMELLKLLGWALMIVISGPFSTDNMHRGFASFFFKIFVVLALICIGAYSVGVWIVSALR